MSLEINQLTGAAWAERRHPQPTVWVQSVVDNSAPTANPIVGYLASAADMNTASPVLAGLEHTSQALLAISGSWTSGLVAVATYASEHVAYNTPYREEPYGPHNESLGQVVTTQEGICVEYASLTSALLQRAGIPAPVVAGTWSFTHQSTVWTLAQMRAADIGGFHEWVQVGALGLDPTGMTGPYDGFEQIDGGAVSPAAAFPWSYHLFLTVPDNAVINNTLLLKYMPQA